jgi:hypothetical protein
MKKLLAFVACVGIFVFASGAFALDYSFTGNFSADNEVQLFTFVVGAESDVTLRTWSYAGGTNAAGEVIASGGFDPILAVFDSTGAFINQNDDGGFPLVAYDSVSGMAWDTYLSVHLLAGSYTVSVMQYSNFAYGPNLSDGFYEDGVANTWFRNHYWDVAGYQRDSHWAFDILNVAEAEVIPNVPEPASMLLLGLGLIGLAGFRKRMK